MARRAYPEASRSWRANGTWLMLASPPSYRRFRWPRLASCKTCGRTRLAQVEAELARRSQGEGPPPATDSRKCKRVEEGMKASEVPYRRLFETAKDGILVVELSRPHAGRRGWDPVRGEDAP